MLSVATGSHEHLPPYLINAGMQQVCHPWHNSFCVRWGVEGGCAAAACVGHAAQHARGPEHALGQWHQPRYAYWAVIGMKLGSCVWVQSMAL